MQSSLNKIIFKKLKSPSKRVQGPNSPESFKSILYSKELQKRDLHKGKMDLKSSKSMTMLGEFGPRILPLKGRSRKIRPKAHTSDDYWVKSNDGL